MTELDNDNAEGLDCEIPFKFVGHEVKIQLANKLDPVSVVTGNDWRLLAEKLGYTADEIEVIIEQRHVEGRNTLKLFNDYLKTAGNSVNKVLKALQEMNRGDALKILTDSLPNIRKKFKESERKEKKVPEENSFCGFPSDYYPSLINGNTYMAPTSSFVHNGYFLPILVSPSHMPSMRPPFHDYHSNSRSHNESHQPDNSPLNQRPVKNRKVQHHGDGYDGCDRSPVCDNTSSISSYLNKPAVSRSTSHKGFDSMEVNYCKYNDRDFSLSNNDMDNDNFRHETPAELPRTILRGEGNLLSSNMSMPNSKSRLSSKRYENSSSNSDDSFSSDSETSPWANGRSSRGQALRKKRSSRTEQRSTPLDNLHNLSQLPQEYMPDESYKTVVAEQKMGKHTRRPTTLIKTEQDVGRQSCNHAFSKVLVTFAYDSDKHMQRVLSLCNCIEKNGFKCCVDIYNRNHKSGKNGKSEKLAFYKEKFEEADFILVCPSKKYHKDTCDDSRSKDSSSSDGLHTKFIYDMMYREFIQNGNNNKRFVPVILEGTSHDDLPRWLLNQTVKYTWPSQYKDLLWMLTRPEERINRHGNRRS
ncbi:uncharacterized protein LOC126824021 isoform X2 [Patella vulgata]|uniref:uncharacterized protein LOC126824021 isoform X2 n=1 Tax=Patella vulgata TaxID=6465 RepID=UPI00218060CB|nr:uncharacterized protein LOC126824021 isoform X2 [Patella vulgata]